MRRFLPGVGGGGGGGGEPSSSSSSGGQHRQRGGERGGAPGGLRYGGGDISLGHGHDGGGGGHRHHQQLGGGEAERQQHDDGSMDMLARHSSSPAGFFSNLMVDNGNSEHKVLIFRICQDVLKTKAKHRSAPASPLGDTGGADLQRSRRPSVSTTVGPPPFPPSASRQRPEGVGIHLFQ